MREGRATDLSVTPGVTPGTGPRAGVFIDRDRAGRPFDQQRLDDQMERLRDRLRDLPFDFNFDVEPPQFEGRPRLGVTVQTLTPQLAAYFGAKNGVLVADVANDSAAAQAGLKAGDVITSVNGRDVLSRSDLTRALNEAGTTGEVTIGIVRDKKTTSVKAKLEDARPPRRESRPVRPVRATPAWPRTEPAGRPRQAEAMRLVSARGAAGKEAASIPVSCAANSEASA
jgi:membrane-associated protease RseP (regulator of RpoE activity)